jgi:hypothetical protein
MMQKSRLVMPSLEALWAGEAARAPQGGHDECRQALANLFLAVSRVYVERPNIPLDHLIDPIEADARDFRKALYEAFHREDINQQMALEAAVQAVSARFIAQEPGVKKALDQARLALLKEVKG